MVISSSVFYFKFYAKQCFVCYIIQQIFFSMKVDFDKMFITKPEKIKIRRTYHSGIGLVYTVSPNQMRVHATVSSIQVG